MAEGRRRERVPIEITGKGTFVDSDEGFNFVANDFTVLGMQFLVRKLEPMMGRQVKMEFDVTDMEHHRNTIVLAGEIVRQNEDGPSSLCGVRWLDEESAENIEALENFYIEQFFDMID